MRRSLLLPVLLAALSLHTGLAQTPSPLAQPPAEPGPPPSPAAASQDKPLPDLSTLISQAKTHADQWQELRKSYMCKETVVADELDAKGNKKGTHTDIFRVFYVEKSEIRQHVSHDGVNLSPSDEKKEQERVDKRIAEIKAHTDKQQRGNIQLSVSSLLKIATVSAPRRESLNGRPTIVFDYRGNSNAKTANIGEEVMKKLAGTIWIDEEDAAVARLNGVLQENFHVAGGLLVNIHKDSRFDIDTTRVNDEIWFTHNFIGHVDGRILLLKGFDGDAHVTYSDYRKMKSTITILPGNHVLDDNGNPLPDVLDPSQPTPPPTPASPPPPPAAPTTPHL